MSHIEKDVVLAAYRAILRREPEKPEVVEWAMRTYSSPEQLLRAFLESDEYQKAPPNAVFDGQFPLDTEPERDIEHEASPKELAQLLDQVHKSWNFLGETDPYYSVVTFDRFKNLRDDSIREEFIQTGRGETERLTRWLDRNRIKIKPGSSCLEYGCGTGRITFHLCKMFQHVFAFDISEPHLKLARENCSNAVAERRVTFQRVTDSKTLDVLPKVDFVFSVIVLQHNPPPIIALILRNLLNALAPGGIAYFQVPTAARNYRFYIGPYLKRELGEYGMEMHVLPQRHVFKIIQDCGCEVLEVQPDGMVGSPDFISNTFLVRKVPSSRI